MDIAFTVEDILPEDSLLRPLMYGLYGDVTMKNMKHGCYHLHNHLVEFTIITIRCNEGVEVGATMKILFTETTYGEIVRIPIDYNRITPILFNKCLLEIEEVYRKNGIKNNEVRKYPVHQILESYYIFISTVRYHEYIIRDFTWRGLLVNSHGDLTIRIDDEIIGPITSTRDIVNNLPLVPKLLMNEMKKGIASERFYVLAIERIKSARKTE